MGYAQRKLKKNHSNYNRKAYLQGEFDRKSKLLSKKYLQTGALTYYEDVFGSDADERRSYLRSSSSRKVRYTNSIEDMLATESDNSDLYLRLCSFYGYYPKMANMKRLYGLAVDIDGVSAPDLQKVLSSAQFKVLTPTYIINSGHGVHLAFIFDKPVEAYNYIKTHVKTLYKALKIAFTGISDNYKVDMTTSIMQPLRVVGSKTKLGQTTTCYCVGKRWGYDELAKALDLPQKPLSPLEQNQTQDRLKEKPSVAYVPNAKAGFYNHTLKRIYAEVQEGNRYTSMLALVIIAYKCRREIEYSKLVSDLHSIVDYFNESTKKRKVKYTEINKALKAYNNKATLTTAERLEEWLGFKFGRSKRNGRKRNEHLKIANQIKHDKDKAERLSIMNRYLLQNPNASLNELVDILGWSRHTVIKYRKMITCN